LKQFIPFLLFVIGLSVPLSLYAQQQYLTRNGIITFDSKLNSFVPVKAENNSVSAILNADDGEIAVLVLVKGFSFKNSLMEEHFNESYAESDIHPKTTFTGKISNFDIQDSKTCLFSGVLFFHGIEKQLNEIPLIVEIGNNRISINGEFQLVVGDFDIKVPRIVRSKIPEEIYVSIDLDLEKLNK
jgi:hypothetical protein